MSYDSYRTQSLDHLGLVAGMIDELNIVKVIDNSIEQDFNQRYLSVGECVKAMILNGLGFVNYQLYLVTKFYENKPVEKLFGKKINHKYFNDDTLGRALDSLYENGVSYIFSRIAFSAVKALGIHNHTYHVDSTSFHLHGKYEDNGMDENIISICKGYSRDHHPELNQIVLDLIVTNKGGIPLAMKPLSGNSSDKADFPKIIREFVGNLKNEKLQDLTMVADSAFYTEDNLKTIPDGLKFISRVPQTNKKIKEIYAKTKASDLTNIDENYSFKEFTTKYGGMEQRWILYRSEHSYKKKLKTFEKKMQKEIDKEEKRYLTLSKKIFACQEDAVKELNIFTKKLKYHQVKEVEVVKIQKVRKSSFQINAILIRNQDKINDLESKLGYFTLATNHLESYSAEEIIKLYKDQGVVERGFRFLKDKTFLASSMFLEKPQRIESLVCVMSLCLMVYAAIEYKIRNALKEKNATYKNQVNKDVQNPTARWIFQDFNGIDLLLINKKSMVLNVQKKHSRILWLLGKSYKHYYT